MKDFSNLKEHLGEKGELKTKEIKELGYTQYDIKQFLEESLLEKKDRGLYVLKAPAKVANPENVEEVTNSNQEINIGDLKRKGTYELSKRFYSSAKKIFEEVLTISPNDYYAYHCLSLIAVEEKDFATAFEYLKKSYQSEENKNIENFVLLFYALSELTAIPVSFIKEVESHLTEAYHKNNYFVKLISPLKKGDTEKCQKRLSYFLRNDFVQRKFRLNNFFLDILLSAIKEKKLVQAPVPEENQVLEETLGSEESSSPTTAIPKSIVIVPEVTETQLVINSLLLDAINSGDFSKARDMLSKGTITNQNEIIEVLLTKLINIQSVLFNQPCKVVGVEPVRIISSSSIDAEIKNAESSPIVREEIVPSREPVSEPEYDLLISSKEEQITPESLEEKIEELYLLFKSSSENYEFDEARKHLVRYELAYKKSGKYRNIKYHYDRLEINKEEYNCNPEQYKKKLETIDKIKKLIALKQYDDAIALLNEIRTLNPKDYQPITLMANIYNRTSRYREAYNILLPYFGICEEPTFFYQMAQASFNIGNYEEALSCCKQYNERRPSQNASIYLIMADCYNRMKKYSKELKALRKAEEINSQRGYKTDLRSRIEKAESSANRKHEYTLAKINKRDVYVD